LVPFAAAILDLEETRRRMEKADGVKAAGVLDGMNKQIDQVRKTAPTQMTPHQARGAAETVGGLRAALRSWFRFYNGYDPLFTWWVDAPYKQVDQALEGYAAFLREKAGEKTEDGEKAAEVSEQKPFEAPAKPPAKDPDVPDLQELLAFPR